MRKVLLSLVAAIALGILPGCGNGHSNRINIPSNPSGGNPAGFTDASLLAGRTYVFTVHGFNRRSGFANFAVAGNFTVDGAGNITSGTRDTVDDLGRQTLNEPITGTYSVNEDGRGQAVLNGSSGQAIYRFVLESPASGKLFQDGTTSHNVVIEAVGDLQLQSGAPGTPTGTYIVRLDGEDSGFNLFGVVGGLAFTGTNINATIDLNDGGFFGEALPGNGTIALSGSRGTATLFVDGFTHHFIVYFVSPTKLALVSRDKNFWLQGSAEAQTSFAATAIAYAAAAPQQVFSLSGFDVNGARVEIGRMTLTSSATLVNAIEDINNTSPNYFAAVNISGSGYAVNATNGRWTATLVPASGSAPTPNLVGWQVSPQRSLVLTTNNNIIETGIMRAQTLGLTTASVSGDFAEALSGFNSLFPQFNIQLIANLRLNGSGSMQGVLDSQDDFSGLLLDAATTGTYSIDPTFGRSINGNIDASSGVSGIPVVYYTVDANTIYFLPSQAGVVYSGSLVGQTP